MSGAAPANAMIESEATAMAVVMIRLFMGWVPPYGVSLVGERYVQKVPTDLSRNCREIRHNVMLERDYTAAPVAIR